MKRLALVVAAIIVSSPAMAADLVNTNGFLTIENTMLQQRVDQFQAGSPSIPANINGMINDTQTFIGGSVTQMKGFNPAPTLTSPIQPFTIPAFPPVH